MRDNLYDIAAVCAGAICGFLWGELDGLMIAFIAAITLDYITGVIAAFVMKTVSSKVGFGGICKKLVTVMVVAVAYIIDSQVINGGGVLRGAVICYFIANEALSMLENAAKMGIVIPAPLKKALAQLGSNTNNKEEAYAVTKPITADNKGESDTDKPL